MINNNALLTTLADQGSGPTVAVKANIAVAGQVCHGGIKAYENDIAKKDARVVTRLREAGYGVRGIANMEEGALGAQTDNPWFGKTHNPLKFGYTAGGSSGGSAAAVAGGLTDIALGTDTMGSVRIPSAYCGLWGFKPSYNAAMLGGVMPLSETLDTVGVHGKSLAQIAAAGAIICAQDLSGGTAGRITLLDWKDHVICSPSVAAVYAEFVQDLSANPVTCLDGYEFGASRRAGLILSEVEGYRFHEARLKAQPEGFSSFFAGMLNYGANLPKAKVKAAYLHVESLRAATFPDFILMPTAPQTAFRFGTAVPANQADFTAFANLADRPAVQFPIGKGVHGLPVGAQLIGPRGGEADLFATLKALLTKN